MRRAAIRLAGSTRSFRLALEPVRLAPGSTRKCGPLLVKEIIDIKQFQADRRLEKNSASKLQAEISLQQV